MIDAVRPGDHARVAALHDACLRRSLLSALGPQVVLRYYKFAGASKSEVVRVARVDGEIAGACLLSMAPGSLLRRFAMHAPWLMATRLGLRIVTDRDLRKRLRARIGERDSNPVQLPEVVQIFTDPAQRGRGIGATLLAACEESLREAGERAYCIHTHRDDNAAGIHFYQREGFTTVGETTSFGDRFYVMTKGLT
jgi:ribosomal protein S18 acetylase RimI-like enzyme